VASDLPPIREIITDGENGLLVDPEDVEGWIAAVRGLQSDPVLTVKLTEQARSAVQRYTWRRRAQDIAIACGWAAEAPTS
jgi:glycosyltransferase involved in cell wall biosynthesis